MATNGTAFDDGGGPQPAKKKDMLVEEIYQKKSQLEHILLRPDTYIGSVEKVTEKMWVFNDETNLMEQRELTYVPGLYKIFDEILVNAADNKQRDSKMSTIKIEIDAEANKITVFNDGCGIPVVMHKKENMYVPTMIFGHLLTSSNYNDEEEKVTGGRNGYGAKLCNIFSTEFTVETASKEHKLSFKQTWSSNMGAAAKPKVKTFTGPDFTKVIFHPDLTKFKMNRLDEDIVALMSRRAYDIAASTKGVKVYLNGKLIKVNNFRQYVDLFVKGKTDSQDQPLKVVHEISGPRWEIAITTSSDGKGFLQMSFVNSIATTKGGRHVEHVVDLITKELNIIVKKKNKDGSAVRPMVIRNQMWVFVNCLIVNPTFDSQTKEHMTLQIPKFGSKCSLSDDFSKKLAKCGIVEQALTWAKFKAGTEKEKKGGTKKSKLTGVPKLEDANDAGTAKSLDCTLILTEGDSAKTLAVSGLGIIGRDKYGVFPLRGKLLNVRDASHKAVMENAEINNIIKIMGLQYKREYNTETDLKSLRYGRLMIMTDQDQDGSHIKGLLINFIHTNWPSLLKIPFLEEFITPIVKVTKGKKVLPFYSLPEFEEWKGENENWPSYSIKYYKGLGTSTSKEAKEYFSDLGRHRIVFKYSGPEDDANIKLAFGKTNVDQRKAWLTDWMADTKRRRELGLKEQYLYEKNTKSVNYSEFVNKELVLFSYSDLERSIPNMMDGLKPGQRKVLFTCLKRNDKKEVKVAQLAGSVGEKSAYHHGEASLMGTIINLAQNYVGSNNINLLQPIGQFGTRLNGGKDSASPRYIFTMLSPLTKLIFHPHDDPLLTAQYDDGLKIEPTFYQPIIPMLLVNGADGIGTGWSTKVWNYNPRELIQNIRRMLGEEEPRIMHPWYKNFNGSIEPLGDTRYAVFGNIGVIDDDAGKLEITELPIGVWTQTYKENVLDPYLNGNDKIKTPIITEYKEYNTDVTVRFTVTMDPRKMAEADRGDGLHKLFKLSSSMATSNMCVFDQNNVLTKYESVSELLTDFYKVRLALYARRKAYLEGCIEAEALKLSNQARFIIEKCDGSLKVENKKKKLMVEELRTKRFDLDPVRAWKLRDDKEAVLAEEAAQTPNDSQAESQDEDEDPVTNLANGYDYLLGMPIWSLTLERKEDLIRKRDEKLQEAKALKAKTPGDLWREDLAALETELDKVEAKERADEKLVVAVAAPTKGQANKRVAAKKVNQQTECLPSPLARRCEPKVEVEAKKRVPKNSAGKKSKDLEPEEKDEFDLLGERPTVTLEQRLGISPAIVEKKRTKKVKENGEKAASGKALKQAKLSFGKTKSPKKRDPYSISSTESESDGSVKFSKTLSPVPQRQAAKRAASAKINFGGSSSEDDDSDADFMASKQKSGKSNVSSDAMFDSLVGSTPSPVKNAPKVTATLDISSDDSPVKKTAVKKATAAKLKAGVIPRTALPKAASTKPAPTADELAKVLARAKGGKKRKTDDTTTEDESDASFKISSPKKGGAKKKAFKVSNDLDSDSENEIIAPSKPRAGRQAAKPAKYNFSDDDDEEDSD